MLCFFLDRLVQSENEILLKSNMVLDQLISAIRAYLPALYNCVELISLLDFFSAMACYSNKTKTGFTIDFFYY